MSPSSNPDQDQSLEDAAIQESQVQLGQAGGDSIQIVGSNNQVVVHPSRSQPLSQEQPLNRQEYRNRQILLNKVRNFWVKGVLEKSLYNKARIELGLEERFDTLELLYETPEQLRQALPSGTKAIDKFDELGEGRTLLILGHPGGGKTTTLLELARDLVQRSEQDATLPIPIVFNLSSWTDKNQKIVDWLVQELNSKYQVSKKIGQVWLQNQQLLLLLDGLDEVKADLREACVQSINQFSQEYGQTEIVVCSRVNDYEVLTQCFRFQGAIFIQPLTSEQIMNYLDEAEAELVGVRTAIQTDIVLEELAQTPLMLSVMALVYQGIPAEQLSNLSPEEQKKHLWDQYIQRMFNRRFSPRRYTIENTKKWLNLMAKLMIQESQSVFFIEQIQPSFLKRRSQKIFYFVGVFLIAGFTYSLIDSTFNNWISEISNGIFKNLSAPKSKTTESSSAGFIAQLIVCFSNKGKVKTIETLKWSWTKAWETMLEWSRRSLKMSIILGLILGLLAFLGSLFNSSNSPLEISGLLPNDQTIYLPKNTLGELLYGLYVGVACGIVFSLVGAIGWGPIGGLIGGISGPSIEQRIRPNQGIYRSAKNSMLITLISIPIMMLIFTFLLGALFCVFARNQCLAGIAVSLIFSPFIALAIAPTVLLISATPCIRHFVLRTIFKCSRIAPWNYARFLDWACDRLFLQRVGGGYIFVHRLLLEHFAQMGTEAERGLSK